MLSRPASVRRTGSLLRSACAVAVLLALALSVGCGDTSQAPREVVVYTALDREFSEPILQAFEARTGIAVRAKYDTEATKSVGLTNALRNEKNRPRCDVFWNNEILNTIRLADEGLLDAYVPQQTANYPETFYDKAGAWSGFATRARILIVNTDLVAAAEMPTSIYAMTDPKWKGKTGIAKPLFGTTATHAACLFAALGETEATAWFAALKENDVRILMGNKQVAIGVADGDLAFGLTDTDDAMSMIDLGKPVAIVYPDSGPDDLGTLYIPNTLSLVKGAPNPDAGKALIEYLLSAEVEAALATGPSAQIPVNRLVDVPIKVKTPKEVKAMDVDFAAAARDFAAAASYIEKHFAVD